MIVVIVGLLVAVVGTVVIAKRGRPSPAPAPTAVTSAAPIDPSAPLPTVEWTPLVEVDRPPFPPGVLTTGTLEALLATTYDSSYAVSMLFVDLASLDPARPDLHVMCAERLLDVIGDRGTVASFHDRELVAALAADEHEVREIARTMLRRLAEDGDDQAPFTRCSVAVMTARTDGELTGLEIFHSADLDDDRLGTVHEPAPRGIELAESVFDHSVAVHYRPVWNLATGRPLGLRAVLHADDHAVSSPEDAVDIAEQTGLIVSMGHMMQTIACGDLRAIRDACGACADRPLRCTVPVSGSQLADQRYPALVELALADAGIDAGSIVLEVRAATLAERSEELAAVFVRLRRAGIDVVARFEDDVPKNVVGSFELSGIRVPPWLVVAPFLEGARTIVDLAAESGLPVHVYDVAGGDDLELAVRVGATSVEGDALARPMTPDDACRFVAGMPTISVPTAREGEVISR
jgi:EAL domain-containing protein (putative c-di-GMP-specific phosphodiesterase class I)